MDFSILWKRPLQEILVSSKLGKQIKQEIWHSGKHSRYSQTYHQNVFKMTYGQTYHQNVLIIFLTGVSLIYIDMVLWLQLHLLNGGAQLKLLHRSSCQFEVLILIQKYYSNKKKQKNVHWKIVWRREILIFCLT